MNRYMAFSIASLATIGVACNPDRPTGDNGVTKMPVTTNDQATVNVPKIKVGSTTYYLTRPGDFIASVGSDSFSVKAGPIAGKFSISAMSIDTIGWGSYQSSGTLYRDLFLTRASAPVSWDEILWGLPSLPNSPWYGAAATLAGGYSDGAGNTAIDSLVVDHVYGSVTNPDSMRLRVFADWYPHGTPFTGTLNSSVFAQDNVGSVQLNNCVATPACVYTLDPASATLSNVVQYAKITWSNNGDVNDSTEVWFGDVNNPTLRETVAPGTTLAFETWLSGSHQYIAKVRHRYNSVVSNFALSNTITR